MTDALIQAQLAIVKERMKQACAQYRRDPSSVNLLAVSKTKPVTMMMAAITAGQRHFGENYLQEALEKKQALSAAPIEWHFIGAIQSNKTRAIAENFDWVHTVASTRVATRLSAQRPAERAPLKVMVQVNISGEVTKAGVDPNDAATIIESISALPGLEVRGLMAIPEPVSGFDAQRQSFARIRSLKESLDDRFRGQLPAFTDLSMGMTDDMEAAIAEGATWLRIGTAIFGARQSAH